MTPLTPPNRQSVPYAHETAPLGLAGLFGCLKPSAASTDVARRRLALGFALVAPIGACGVATFWIGVSPATVIEGFRPNRSGLDGTSITTGPVNHGSGNRTTTRNETRANPKPLQPQLFSRPALVPPPLIRCDVPDTLLRSRRGDRPVFVGLNVGR